MHVELSGNALSIKGARLLGNVSEQLEIESDPTNTGAFLILRTPKPHSRHEVPLGKVCGLERFVSCFRYEPFWMKPAIGTELSQVPVETQFLLCECTGGRLVLIVPLYQAPFRFVIEGTSQGLNLIGETNDAYTVGHGGLAVFVATGTDVYDLMDRGARAVMARMKTGRLRREKAVPDFADYFGWCTWDAFYREVTAANVREGLDAFRKGGVEPRLLILDDGWQSYDWSKTGEERLTAIGPNARFGGDLAPTVHLAKHDFKVKVFLAWHSIIGYWGGVDGERVTNYGVKDTPRMYGRGILHHMPHGNHGWWGALAGLVPAEHIHRFYHDLHRMLREQGVDGVKIDTQGMVEGLALGSGGRVALNRAYREAMEGSVDVHFNGRLINCMASAQETYYGSLSSNLQRTSTDFWPKQPATHGLHLYTNSHVSLWFGEFMHPDWDMFQSRHPVGAFHAAARAISGSPIYVSDKPGNHDFDLLRKLVCSDGTVLRCTDIGRPTRDCVFADVLNDPVLLKVFNRNETSGVVGVFNCRFVSETAGAEATVQGTTGPADVAGLAGKRFAAFSHQKQTLQLVGAQECLSVAFPQYGWDVFTYACADGDFAPIGLADKLNSGGAVSCVCTGPTGHTVCLRDGGDFIAWCARKPKTVKVAEADMPFTFEEASGTLRVKVPAHGEVKLTVAV